MSWKESLGASLLISTFLFVLQPAGSAQALPLVAGGSYQFEDHSGENHRNESLAGIDVSFGSFAGTNLRNTILTGGSFVQTNFTNANMRNVDLQNADLTDAIFGSGSNLRDANLSGASLLGIDLTGVNITNTNFSGAFYDASSILPFDPVAAGMVPVPEPSPLMMTILGLAILAGMRTPRSQSDPLLRAFA